ncbi:hypothetical protein B0H19DRAFT_1066007 [Mycena capillaripes]|nr:hypothetical protein B0H19DRAFT_1066007 [Mycena capillaripes]
MAGRVWYADEIEAREFGKEETIIMVFAVLAETWDQAHSADLRTEQVKDHKHYRHSPRRRTSSCASGENANKDCGINTEEEQRLKDTIGGLADLLSCFASTIMDEVRTTRQVV